MQDIKRMHTRLSSAVASEADLVRLSSSERRQSRPWQSRSSSDLIRLGNSERRQSRSSSAIVIEGRPDWTREDEANICRLSAMRFVYMLNCHPVALFSPPHKT